MTEKSAQPPLIVEKTANAMIARVQVKLLDEAELKMLGKLIDDAAATGEANLIVVDLAKVHMLPSLGLGVLVQIAQKCRARSQKLRLAALTPQIRQVFAITKLDRVLEITDTVEHALEA